MATPMTISADDEALVAELGAAAALYDPPPALLQGFLEGMLSWRDPDAELAQLVADSRDLADAVRGGQLDVLVRFEAGPFSVTFEASQDASGLYRITGQIEPGATFVVEILYGNPASAPQVVLVDSDEWGRFEASPVPSGPISLRLIPERGKRVRTEWVVL
jgi:hypothetical protein